MNGQLFSSSGSANDTPTPPSNNSYPASLSSESSRDASPSHGPRAGPNGANGPYRSSPYGNHYPTSQQPTPGYQTDQQRTPWSDNRSMTAPDRFGQYPASSMYQTKVNTGQAFSQNLSYNRPAMNDSFSNSNFNDTPAFNSSGYGQMNPVSRPLPQTDSHLVNNQTINKVSSYSDSLTNSSGARDSPVLQQPMHLSQTSSAHLNSSPTPPSAKDHHNSLRPHHNSALPTSNSISPVQQVLHQNSSQNSNFTSLYSNNYKMPGDGSSKTPATSEIAKQDDLFPVVGRQYNFNASAANNNTINEDQLDDIELDSDKKSTGGGDQWPPNQADKRFQVGNNPEMQNVRLSNSHSPSMMQPPGANPQSSSPGSFTNLPAQNSQTSTTANPPPFSQGDFHRTPNNGSTANQFPPSQVGNHISAMPSGLANAEPNTAQDSAPTRYSPAVNNSRPPPLGATSATPPISSANIPQLSARYPPSTSTPPSGANLPQPSANYAPPTAATNPTPAPTSAATFAPPAPTAATSFAPTRSTSNFPPPTSGANHAPPTSNTNFVPPTSGSNFAPSRSTAPPATGTNFTSASSSNLTSGSNFAPPPTSGSSFASPASAANFAVPPTSAASLPPSKSTAYAPPNTGATSSYAPPTLSTNFVSQKSSNFAPPQTLGTNIVPSSISGSNFSSPPTSASSFAPPPNSGTNFAPTLTSASSFAPPPTSGTNFAPTPTSASSFAPPPTSGTNFAPTPTSRSNVASPPTSGSSFAPPPTSGSNFAPPSGSGSNFALPPTSRSNIVSPPTPGSNFAPPISSSNFAPPPTSGSNFAPPTSGSKFGPPPTSGSNFAPPQTSGSNFAHPPTPGSRFAPPPTSGSNFAPPSGSNYGPPASTPGFAAKFGPPSANYPPGQQPPVMSQPRPNMPPLQNAQFQNRYPPTSATGVQYTPTAAAPPYNQQQQLQGPYRQPPGPQFQQMRPPQPGMMDSLTNQFRAASVTQEGYNRLWGMDTLDLLKTRDLLSKDKTEAPPIRLNPEMFDANNCSPELFRCTLAKIPESKALLEKSRLPLGVLIHPFKDMNQLSVIQCTTIVRCRTCRTYINPFVYFVDNKRWKCNLCFRVNELPDEFQFDPQTKTYGDPSRRPEIRNATIEFIAPSEYMVRPPQPAIYLFLLDVSRLGAECGYLQVVCQTLLQELDQLPGDARTSVGFIAYDSAVHFYSMADGLNRPHQMTVVDINDMFLPCPDNLIVNLSENIDLVRDLLTHLPTQYAESYDTESALGAALQAAYKLLAPTGGRVTVFQARLPSVGPGALASREDPSQRAGDSVPHLNPSTDFYKKLALDCSGQQVAVDLFFVNSQYVDVATLSGVSRFSGGCMHHFPLFRAVDLMQVKMLQKCLRRYLSRKIGFESVMRLRCTRGLSVHTFHGNFFVRSTDLLSLPNVNPDAGFGMQVSIDENLSELQTVCFQAALLYTSSKGERRIRVHTLCLPIANSLSDVLNSADQLCIIGLLSKMAVDRSMESSISDAREAFVNVAADILSAYRLTQSSAPHGSLLAAHTLRLIPLYILALLKFVAFRIGQSTRLDDRVFAMCQLKSLPLAQLLQLVYPDLYPIHDLEKHPVKEVGLEREQVHDPPRLHLSAERVDSHGVYLLDCAHLIIIYVGHNCPATLCQALFGKPSFSALPHESFDLPELDTPESDRLFSFIHHLCSEKAYVPCIQVIRDDSHHRMKFLEQLVEDKNEAGTSYYEFLQRIKQLGK
ncbi:protein transport protein Sec24A isoform X2 [Nilaparvata lugens]|uniref:protein transport protein Sec24A isoform X2 n=1 Tax=Nilaparvata lugens TaxID=108931 RepID=UPI00193DC439|nr:protein transport protein Sec24A isoform X2 [Nilaparvata lugens]